MVSHTHGLNSNNNLVITDPGHTHDYDVSSGDTQSGSGDDGGSISQQETESRVTGIFISGSTESQGVSGTNANLPPYYALAFIMRTT